MKKVIILTGTKSKVLSKVLAQHGVKACQNKFGYKELAFKQDDFKNTFFKVMKYLAVNRVWVEVLNVIVQKSPSIKADNERYKNWKHSEPRYVNYFDPIEKGLA